MRDNAKKFGLVLGGTKQSLLRRMFWGRGNWYKNSFHIAVLAITLLLLIAGVLPRINNYNEGEAQLDISYGAITNNDLLAQGASLSTVLAVDPSSVNYKIFEHKVKRGDTIRSIAKQYDVSVDTIVWANDDIINPFIRRVYQGTTLKIPEIDGVLYEAKRGDTAKTIAKKTNGNIFDIIELNDLLPPKYKVKPGQRILVPLGELPPEPLPGLYKEYFANPLSHPACRGYRYVRGFTSYHSGLDLSKSGGCPIRAVAAGKVLFAGWGRDGLSGYMVVIEHGDPGNGESIKSYYLHGDGRIWVKEGDFVKKGQDIMYMGNTGNSTGTHLHLTIQRNNVNVNPASYIPY